MLPGSFPKQRHHQVKIHSHYLSGRANSKQEHQRSRELERVVEGLQEEAEGGCGVVEAHQEGLQEVEEDLEEALVIEAGEVHVEVGEPTSLPGVLRGGLDFQEVVGASVGEEDNSSLHRCGVTVFGLFRANMLQESS